ncbi:putative hydro-lyase [Pollutimonas harenae]|uniref:Putative hydro-lyase H0A62_04585 n=1 Tax=Pollutimonas harenae TaxID=657015 RepID=A0A853H416_9BURK|nr:putative hydro-lyase [Pollutimonas harenae]NYT84874.1 putative hydro-lyase [Pollutimonas harenae]TEA72728.1 putative hydro-lyase [Pollutimonas harenae]
MNQDNTLHTTLTPEAANCRALIRRGAHTGPTAGLAPGYVQANLMILPKDLANEFLLFCQRNPKPCPLLSVAEPGQYAMPALGQDIDLRQDVPKYRVWHHGELASEPKDLMDIWRDDLVSFAIGCSFSFEEALLANSIDIRHISQGRNVPMYRTNIPTANTSKLHGPLVVSMRPMKAHDAIRAVQVTSRFPAVHGAPIHLGDPALIGIQDINQPDYGDPVDIHEGEIPVFWACGVTPQSIIHTVKPAFSITHAPGHMLITDISNASLASF